MYEKLRNYQTLDQKQRFAFDLLDSDGDGFVSLMDLGRFYQMTTGLSEDAAEYHARAFLAGRTGLEFEAFLAEISMKDVCAKFDLPPIEVFTSAAG